MDWNSITSFAETCLNQKIEEFRKSLQNNKTQLAKISKVTERLEKFYKDDKKTPGSAIPRSKSPAKISPIKSESRIKSLADAKKAEELKKTQAKEAEEVKKTEKSPKKKENSLIAKPSETKEDEDKKKKEISKKNEETASKIKKTENHEDKPKIQQNSAKKKEESKLTKTNSVKIEENKSRPTDSKIQKKITTVKPSENKPEDKKTEENQEDLSNQSKSGESDEGEKKLISLKPNVKIYTKEELERLIFDLKDVSKPKKEANFVPSVGLQVFLHSLSSLDSASFYLNSEPRPEFLWVFKAIWAFSGKNLDDGKAFEEIKDFICNPKNRSRLALNIGQRFIDLIDNFDFSNENIDKVEKIVAGVELDFKKFREKCKVSGVLIHLIKEAGLFGGVFIPEGPDWRVLSRYSHKLSQLSN